MSNVLFDIANLGVMKFIVSLVDFDYPRTFVCKKDNSESVELFLFDEFDHGESFVKWLCVQISVDELDKLNRGQITLDSCFYGPRGSKKEGYIVTSENGQEKANAAHCANVSQFVVDKNTYVEEFIDNFHGASLMSLIYEKPIVAMVLRPEKYADPMISSTRVTNGSNNLKSTLNSMPYGIDTRTNRMCFSQTHSLVLYFEVTDKKEYDGGPLLSETYEPNHETHGAFMAMKTMLDGDSSDEAIINAFKGDKKSIEKMNSFVNEVEKNNNGGHVLIEAVDYSSGVNNSIEPIGCEINSTVVENTKKRSDNIIKIIDSSENHTIESFYKVGQFLMLDITGRKKFKFQSVEKDDNNKIYSGFSEVQLNGFAVDKYRNTLYKVKIQSDILRGSFGNSKPIYTLIEICEPLSKTEQIEIFGDK